MRTVVYSVTFAVLAGFLSACTGHDSGSPNASPSPSSTPGTPSPTPTPDTIIAPSVHVLPDSAASEAVVAVDYILVPSAGNESLLNLVTGDLVASGFGAGFLREVVSVEQVVAFSGVWIKITTTAAALRDAILLGSLDAQLALDDIPLVDLAGRVLLDDTASGISLTIAQGGVHVADTTLSINADFHDGALQTFGIHAAGTLTADLVLSAEIYGGASRSGSAIVWQSSPQIFHQQLGILPVVEVATLSLECGYEVSVEGTASVTAGATASIPVSAGVSYADGQWTESGESGVPAFAAVGPTWQFEATAGVTIYLRPRLDVKFYGVAGPYLSVKASSTLDLQIAPAPAAWTLSGGLSVDLGIDATAIASVLGIDEWSGDYKTTLYSDTWPLASGNLAAPKTVSVVGGGGYSLALRDDGSVWQWGSVSVGPTVYDPTQLSGIDGVSGVAAGQYHALALRGDGSVWHWGSPISGYYISAPTRVSSLHGITAVAAGWYNTFAVDQTGTLWAWGHNQYGQIGDGSTTTSSQPVVVPGLTGVVAAASGVSHTLALLSDGTVWSWGSAQYGQLGDGTGLNQHSPVPVQGVSGVVAIAAGVNMSAALRDDGTVWTWGRNDDGQLGLGDTMGRNVPIQVPGVSDATAISVSSSRHVLVRHADGTLSGWGKASSGQLGDGRNGYFLGHGLSASPVEVFGLTGVQAFAAGANHSLALLDDGSLWGWGSNFAGELGIGSGALQLAPVAVKGLAGITSLSFGGNDRAAASLADGSVWSWGSNEYQAFASGPVLPILGTGNLQQGGVNTPEQVEGIDSISSVAAGADFTAMLADDGTVWTLGVNTYGQLGNGTTVLSTTPVLVVNSNLGAALKIAAGTTFSLALRVDGEVWAWGRNVSGQLGDETFVNRSTPVLVVDTSGAGFIDVAAGGGHALGLRADGTVWSWGDNSQGQLGDGSFTNRSKPVQVPGITTAVGIAAGGAFSLALLEDGTVWSWGWNANGQLGRSGSSSIPAVIPGLGSVVAVSAGGAHSMAAKSDGSAWTWGSNNQGEIGNGATSSSVNTPTRVVGLTDVTAVIAGDRCSFALLADGTARAWGNNQALGNGFLGDGAGGVIPLPVLVPPF